jgi:DNA-binding NtrC family response regulator
LKSASVEILHPSLVAGKGEALAGAGRTDEERVALLLEACGLLSQLCFADWRLRDGWRGARVSAAGRLVAVRAVRGGPGENVRDRLLELVELLFEAEGEVPGRGRARKAVRSLVERWRHWYTVLSADEAAEQILETACFLQKPRFAGQLSSLACRHETPVGSRLWIAGRATGRGRWWRGLGASGPMANDRVPAGSSRASLVREWGAETVEGELAELCSAHEAGRWREVIARADSLGPASDPRLRLDATLLQVHALLRLGHYREAERCLRWPNRERRGLSSGVRRLSLLKAWVQLEAGSPLPDEDSLVGEAPPTEMLRGYWLLVWARLEVGRGRCRSVSDALARALGERRRDSRPLRGRLWTELATLRRLDGDLDGATRASRHAYRYLRRDAGRVVQAEGLLGLLDVDLRLGRIGAAAETLDWADRVARAAGDVRCQRRVALGRLRLHSARGDAARAIELAEELTAARRSGVDSTALEALALLARGLGVEGRREEAQALLRALPGRGLSSLEPEERPLVWALSGSSGAAAAAASQIGWQALWSRLLCGDLEALPGSLHPWRRARLLHDLHLLSPDLLPWQACRWAAAVLRRAGAEGSAERLDNAAEGPWPALRRFLERTDVEVEDVGELFRRGGRSDVRLELRLGAGDLRLLVAGPGGEGELKASLSRGDEVVLRAPRIDDGLACLFRVAVSRLEVVSRETTPSAPLAAGGLIGRSRVFVAAVERAGLLGRGELSVLVLGETGTGKEMMARYLHEVSGRGSRTLLPVNCAALSESLLLSELFGHGRGAFTGADRERAGVFETAQGGTVFLDEVGDLPLSAQGSLLRVLQEGEVRRLGESRLRRVDVRIVAATHRDLAEMVEHGSFRADLYYRLKAAPLRLPALRERGEDIGLLARHFLSRAGAPVRLSREVEERLVSYSWPGNVRELRNTIELAATLGRGEHCLRAVHLELPTSGGEKRARYHAALEAERRRLGEQALAAAGGRRAGAARQLGITAQALSYLVRRLNVG